MGWVSAAGNLCAPTGPARPPREQRFTPTPHSCPWGGLQGVKHSWVTGGRMQTQQERWPRSCADRSCHEAHTPQPQPGGAPTRTKTMQTHTGTGAQIPDGNVCRWRCEPRHNDTSRYAKRTPRHGWAHLPVHTLAHRVTPKHAYTHIPESLTGRCTDRYRWACTHTHPGHSDRHTPDVHTHIHTQSDRDRYRLTPRSLR